MLTTKGDNTFIVPGGSTPQLFFQYLAEKVTDWTGVTIIPSDERLVEETSPECNYNMIKVNLIRHIYNKEKPMIFSFLDGNNVFGSDQNYLSFKVQLTQMMPPKAAFLGIGRDGHTASLFPGKEKLNFTSEPTILIKRDKESFHRVSLSTTFLANTPRLIFLVSGEKKRPVMKKIFNNNNNVDYLPIMQVIKKSSGSVTMFCDQDASPYD